jgi:hypothetical protein
MDQPGPYQERAKNIYTKLRNNLIDTVYKVKISTNESTENAVTHTLL